MDARPSRLLERLASVDTTPVQALGTVLLFLFAVQLLGSATDAAAPLLEPALRRVVVGDASALGISWTAAYLLANGSVVAALALSLFDAGILTPAQLFLMIAGSRLGAAAIVVFVGAFDWFHDGRYSLQESVSMGLLTFLLTLTIYLPVTVGGYVALPHLLGPLGDAPDSWLVGLRSLTLFEPLTVAITTTIGPVPAFLLAVATLFGSLRLFDRVLAGVDTETLRRRFFSHFRRAWLSFGIGLVVTGLTTSVAFSLGVIVPLYNREYVERDELIPYVLGANLGTLFDTVLVAVVLRTGLGVTIVLALLSVATLVTLAVLLAIDGYSRLIVTIDDRLVEDRWAFVGFVLALVLVPFALVVVPLAVR